MDPGTLVEIGKALWNTLKRPDAGLLLFATVGFLVLDAFWGTYGFLHTGLTIALLVATALFFLLAMAIGWLRGDADAWKPFLLGSGLSLIAALLFGDTWLLFSFAAACALATALLATRQRGSHAR